MLTEIRIEEQDRPKRATRAKVRERTSGPGRSGRSGARSRPGRVRSWGALAWAGFVLGLVALSALGSVLSARAGLALYRHVFPDVTVLKRAYPVATGKDGARIIFEFRRQKPAHWVSLEQIPKKAVAAILVSEDARFFEHHGYEPDSIREAMEHNRKPGVKVLRGGSTITQQVVKNLFLSPEKTVVRKVRELLLAVELERRFPKRKILETYLNIAEWGPGVYGIESAAEHYFHKKPSSLTARDGAILAFMLPNPIKYQNSLRDGMSDFAHRRVDTILEALWKTGKISDEEYTSAGDGDGVPSDL